MSGANEQAQADGLHDAGPRHGHNNPPDALSEYASARDDAKRYLLDLIREETKQDNRKIGWLERAYRMYISVQRDEAAKALFEDELKGFGIKPTKVWGKFLAYLKLLSKQVEQDAKDELASTKNEEQAYGTDELEARINPRTITQDFNRLGRALTVVDIIIHQRNGDLTPEVYAEGMVSDVIQSSQWVKLPGITAFKCGSIKAASDALTTINKSQKETRDSVSDKSGEQENSDKDHRGETEQVERTVWHPKTQDVLDRALRLVAGGEVESIKITLDLDGRIVVSKERRDSGYAAIAYVKAGLNEEAQVDDGALFPIEAAGADK